MRERHRPRRGRSSVSGVDPREAQIETPFGFRNPPGNNESQFMRYVDAATREVQVAMQQRAPSVGRVFYDSSTGQTVYEFRSINSKKRS